MSLYILLLALALSFEWLSTINSEAIQIFQDEEFDRMYKEFTDSCKKMCNKKEQSCKDNCPKHKRFVLVSRALPPPPCESNCGDINYWCIRECYKVTYDLGQKLYKFNFHKI